MLMQGKEAEKVSWQPVDECWICMCIVAMWSSSIKDGFARMYAF